MTIIYDVLLKQRNYEPLTGYYGEARYTCIFYDDDRNKALKEMQKYVDSQGFTTLDKKFHVENVVLRERESVGNVISITPYCELFNTVTGKLKAES